MKKIRLGQSALNVAPICLGTMTFGEQVAQADAHRILARSLERGVDFLDTAEMYSVPARTETYGATETIIGNYFASNPGVRQQWTLATKAAGPQRGMEWIRQGAKTFTGKDIIESCHASLKRLQTDVIDLYQIHWPARHVPAFGITYFDPEKDQPTTSVHDQLEALGQLVKAGKVREVGLSNETPWGVMEFTRLAAQHGLPRVATVQNPYCLINRTVDNALDEVLYREQVALLAYSPLGFGLLTGKYDQVAPAEAGAARGRMSLYESMQKQRWGRPEALEASRRYNALARRHGISPTAMALAFCYQSWRVASTIIGVTSVAQLDECLDAWDTPLTPELLDAIDQIRWDIRDPAL